MNMTTSSRYLIDFIHYACFDRSLFRHDKYTETRIYGQCVATSGRPGRSQVPQPAKANRL